MKKLIQTFLLSTVIAFTSGCATIVGESKYPVVIQSEPVGTKFTIRDIEGNIISSGRTPKTVVLKARAGYFKRGTYEITFERKKVILLEKKLLKHV